jgi:hypothetical protein
LNDFPWAKASLPGNAKHNSATVVVAKVVNRFIASSSDTSFSRVLASTARLTKHRRQQDQDHD